MKQSLRRFRPIQQFTETYLEYFWETVDRTAGYGPDGDCWIWLGGRRGRGYGTFSLYGRGYVSTRLMWFIVHGQDPSKLLVLHSCDNPPCVNPDHLFLGTDKDNLHDAIRKGRVNVRAFHQISPVISGREGGVKSGEVRRARTHCPKGHLYAGNIRFGADGCRRCLTCDDVRKLRDLQRRVGQLESRQQ